jgi:hypothetical protein
MKLIALLLISHGLSVMPLASAAPVESQAAGDYSLGVGVGYCVVAKCQVLRGFLLTDSPKSGEPVTIRVDRVFFGPPMKLGNMTIPYEDLDHARGQDSGALLAQAWMKVRMLRNTPVTVALGLARGFGVRPGEPVVVTSDEREAEIIRSLAEEASRLEGSADLISADVASLSSGPNPALAGYLFVNLVFSNPSMQRDLRSSLLSQMLGDPSVPGERLQEIVGWLQSGYPSLSPTGRSALVRRLVELGQQSNVDAAAAGYYGLEQIAKWDDSVTTLVSPAALDGLRDAYRAMVSKGRIPRNPQLETVLGIKPE